MKRFLWFLIDGLYPPRNPDGSFKEDPRFFVLVFGVFAVMAGFLYLTGR